MTALTIKHPWVAAIAHWGKRVENRCWAPPRSAIGKWHGLHGGTPPTGKSRLEALADLARLIDAGLAPVCTLAEATMPGMVGVFRLDGVRGENDLAERLHEDPWFAGPYGWEIGAVVLFREPIACPGALKLWEIPKPIYEQMREAWKEVVS